LKAKKVNEFRTSGEIISMGYKQIILKWIEKYLKNISPTDYDFISSNHIKFKDNVILILMNKEVDDIPFILECNKLAIFNTKKINKITGRLIINEELILNNTEFESLDRVIFKPKNPEIETKLFIQKNNLIKEIPNTLNVNKLEISEVSLTDLSNLNTFELFELKFNSVFKNIKYPEGHISNFYILTSKVNLPDNLEVDFLKIDGSTITEWPDNFKPKRYNIFYSKLDNGPDRVQKYFKKYN